MYLGCVCPGVRPIPRPLGTKRTLIATGIHGPDAVMNMCSNAYLCARVGVCIFNACRRTCMSSILLSLLNPFCFSSVSVLLTMSRVKTLVGEID